MLTTRSTAYEPRQINQPDRLQPGKTIEIVMISQVDFPAKTNQQKTMNTMTLKKRLAAICICIMATFAVTEQKSEAAYYDTYYSNYSYYESLAYSYWWAFDTYYYAYAMPYLYYYYAGLYGDMYGYYDSEGWKEAGWGPYYYDLYAYWGDWYWNTY